MFKQDGQNQTSCQKPAPKTIESSVRFLPDARKHGYVKIAALAGICLALGLGVSLLSPLFYVFDDFLRAAGFGAAVFFADFKGAFFVAESAASAVTGAAGSATAFFRGFFAGALS